MDDRTSRLSSVLIIKIEHSVLQVAELKRSIYTKVPNTSDHNISVITFQGKRF